MAIENSNTGKENKTWRNITRIAGIIIIIVAVFFIYRGFFGNPVEGKWQHEDSDMVLDVRNKNEAFLSSARLQGVKVRLTYEIETKSKEITFHVDQEELDKALEKIEDPNLAGEVESMAYAMDTTYHYNIESNKMELLEWDYGDQLIFDAVQ